MATKKATGAAATLYSGDADVPRPRLHKLIIRNFCAIGTTPIEIELDDIVVLVGPNNVGKSSILKAYEVAMNQGSKEGALALPDFPNGVIDPAALPEIELQTIVYDNSPGATWIGVEPNTGEKLVRERWLWAAPGNPTRQGFDVEADAWSDHVPWGAPNVANSRRPQPHRVDAFASPEDQANEIVKLLKAVLEERIKSHKAAGGDEGEKTKYDALLDKIGELQSQIVEEAAADLTAIETQLSSAVGEVFPGYVVKFDAKPEEDLDKCLALFKAAPQLLMGPSDGHMSEIARQGSGARRTLLWSALRIIKEAGAKKAEAKGDARPHVLLLDEPEICLHPNAIREARRVLYNLPESGNWQVMVTTHSPIFIDLARDNTTIIRIERNEIGEVSGKTLFRPNRAQLDTDDRRRMKMLNLCDPYVNEFFFGGRIVVVEGDTEYTAFRYVAEQVGGEFSDLQVIRARGKATIATLVRVLNHFGVAYAVLHDSDRPTIKRRDGNEVKNGAWTANELIRSAIVAAPDPARVQRVASVPNFEGAFLGKEVDGDKPYNALLEISQDAAAFGAIQDLLRGLLDSTKPLPAGAVRWNSLDDLQVAVELAQGQAGR